METVSSITACTPLTPTNADDAVTLRSPLSVLLDDQAEKLPDSNPSAKIRSDCTCVGEGVKVASGVLDAVELAVTVGVSVGVNVIVGVFVGTGVDVFVGV